MNSFLRIAVLTVVFLAFGIGSTHAGVNLVEPGHMLNQLADSAFPLDPTHSALDTACAFGDEYNIESIGVDALSGMLYVQVGGFADTCIFDVTPTLPGIVTLINPSTGFNINSRGTDLDVDPSTGLLVTQDLNPAITNRIAVVNPVGGATGTYASVTPPVFSLGTFGMDFSAGVGGGDVPAGDIVFTSDVAANGIHSATSTIPGSILHATPPTPGDDIVIQPDGDWVHVPDFQGVITAYSPAPPHAALPSATGLNISGIFENVGLPFFCGSRATVCDTTGDLYISQSCFPGGSGIFRVDQNLTTATHVLTISEPDGLHDLTLGPATSGFGFSVYFTVHDTRTSGEEIWEVTVPECLSPPVAGCFESVNPSGNNIPPAGRTTMPGPRGGQNEDGFYLLTGDDAQGPAEVFVTNASGSYTFGPFASGTVVKITEAPGATPTMKPMGGSNSAVAYHIRLDSDAFVFAVDASGEVSTVVSCLLPPPPK